MASSSAGDDAPVKAVMVNSVPGAESVESSAKSADLQTFTKPQWYHGQKLPNTLTRISGQKNRLGDLEFEILHEILVEKMNNPDFSVHDVSKFLGVNVDTIYPALWRHNSELIEFGSLARDTAVKHDKIRTRPVKWRDYRKFIDEQGGCSNPYNPAEAACLLFPRRGIESCIVKGSPTPADWVGGWRQGRLSGLSRDSRLAKVADQVSGIVPSSGDQSPPFPPPRAPPPPHLKPNGSPSRPARLSPGTAAAARQQETKAPLEKAVRPRGARQKPEEMPPEKERAPYAPYLPPKTRLPSPHLPSLPTEKVHSAESALQSVSRSNCDTGRGRARAGQWWAARTGSRWRSLPDLPEAPG